MPAQKKQQKSQGEPVQTGFDGGAIPGEVDLPVNADSALACCAQDILERQRAEDALRESESYSKAFHSQSGFLMSRRFRF